MPKASTTSLVSGSPRTPTAGTADDTSSRRAAASPRHAGTPRAQRSHRWRRERTRVKKTWSHWHVSTAVCHIWINVFFVFYSVQNMENTSVHWCNKLPIKPPVTHIILSFLPHRQHPGAVYLQFWERAEEGGSGHPSPAESRTHPGALQWQHPQESQHQVSHQLRHLARVVSLYVLESQWNSQFRAFFYLNILQTVFINCPKSSVKCPLIHLDFLVRLWMVFLNTSQIHTFILRKKEVQ